MGALPEGQRFSSTRQPKRNRVAWLRELMSEAAQDAGPGGGTHREAIGRHLIEVATKWEVIVRGHGDNAIEVASARDSVAAAQVLFQYDLGRPPLSDDEAKLAVAAHFQLVARTQVEIGLKLLGSKLEGMTDEQKLAFWERCEKDPRRFLDAAMEEIQGREHKEELPAPTQQALAEKPEPSTDAPAGPGGDDVP